MARAPIQPAVMGRACSDQVDAAVPDEYLEAGHPLRDVPQQHRTRLLPKALRWAQRVNLALPWPLIQTRTPQAQGELLAVRCNPRPWLFVLLLPAEAQQPLQRARTAHTSSCRVRAKTMMKAR